MWVRCESRITPAAAARHLNLHNLIMVVFGNRPEPAEFAVYQESFHALRRVVWSVMGDSSSTRNNESADLDTVLALAAANPNVVGGIMDDLFLPPGDLKADGPVARWDAARIAAVRRQLNLAPRRLDLLAVFYDLLLGVQDAVIRDRLREHLATADAVTYWTWRAAGLASLESGFAQAEALARANGNRLLLGCYLYDYGDNRQMPVELMERQCELGLQWLRAGRIEGMIFLGSPIVDLPFPAVAWARDWIARVGDQPLGSPADQRGRGRRRGAERGASGDLKQETKACSRQRTSARDGNCSSTST
jgi:hypothetical protein